MHFQEMLLCFGNIIERLRGSFMMRFSLSCLVLSFQISTSVDRAMGVVRISVLTHKAPIIVRVKMVSICAQTNRDVTVGLILPLPILTLFLWSNPGICSLRCKTSHHQICWSLEAVDLGSWWSYCAAAEVSVKFQSDWKCLNAHIAALSLHEILQ